VAYSEAGHKTVNNQSVNTPSIEKYNSGFQQSDYGIQQHLGREDLTVSESDDDEYEIVCRKASL
jgi:hypothetical protein